MERRQSCPPLLSGGRRGSTSAYNHGFSSGQIQSLAAICETLIPPLRVPASNWDIPVDQQQAIRSFYIASGSQSPLPDEVAEFMVERGVPEAMFIVRLVLKLLSYGFGILLLCGFMCLNWNWHLSTNSLKFLL